MIGTDVLVEGLGCNKSNRIDEKGKPVERRGRKATGLKFAERITTAGLPSRGSFGSALRCDLAGEHFCLGSFERLLDREISPRRRVTMKWFEL